VWKPIADVGAFFTNDIMDDMQVTYITNEIPQPCGRALA
jgi:hypothetical protein